MEKKEAEKLISGRMKSCKNKIVIWITAFRGIKMAIYLVQHGKAVSKNVDPKRPLSEEGAREVKKVAKTMKKHGNTVDSIKHSGKRRALETARIFAQYLEPADGVSQIDGINPMDSVEPFSKSIADSGNIMFVGHLPFLEKLVSHLVTGDEEKPVIKFQNGGIVLLEKEDQSWFIKWALFPGVN